MGIYAQGGLFGRTFNKIRQYSEFGKGLFVI